MYRSGSTWQYDVAAHLLERHRAGQRLGFVLAEDYRSDPGQGWRVLKSHDAHRAFADALAAGRALALYSSRDLRDVAYSLLHKFGGTFEEVVEHQGMLHRCLDNDAFWAAQPHTLAQRYEEIMAAPAGAVAAVAAHLGIALEEGEAEAVAGEYSLQANLERTGALRERLRGAGVQLEAPANAQRWDEHTLLHWNHIRAGRVGGWRTEATPRELAVLAGICGQWLIERGYERDLSWALPALEQFCGEMAAAQEALHEARQQLAERTRDLEELRQFGPLALVVARRLHAVAARYPRFAGAIRRWFSAIVSA
jgi:hypothetical protein